MNESHDDVPYDPFDSTGGQVLTWVMCTLAWVLLVAMTFGLVYAIVQYQPGIIVAIMGYVAFKAQPWRRRHFDS